MRSSLELCWPITNASYICILAIVCPGCGGPCRRQTQACKHAHLDPCKRGYEPVHGVKAGHHSPHPTALSLCRKHFAAKPQSQALESIGIHCCRNNSRESRLEQHVGQHGVVDRRHGAGLERPRQPCRQLVLALPWGRRGTGAGAAGVGGPNGRPRLADCECKHPWRHWPVQCSGVGRVPCRRRLHTPHTCKHARPLTHTPMCTRMHTRYYSRAQRLT